MSDPFNGKNMDGTFAPGWKGGGRPKIPDELKIKARDLCPAVIDTWEEILRDKNAKDSDRIKAGENIYYRAYGNEPQVVNAEVATTKEVDLSKVPKEQLDAIVNALAVSLAPNEAES